MKPLFTALLFIHFALASGVTANNPDAMPDKQGQQEAIASVAPDIDAFFLKHQEEAHVPGMVWGVVRDGELVYTGGSGVQSIETEVPVGPDSLFRIASMSKAFTALAILKLRDDGLLALDDPVEKHIPELAGWKYPTSDSPRIRIRDLLSHAAGLVYDDAWGDRQQPLPEEEFTGLLEAGMPFSSAPQTQFEYSNTGYALLGRVITNVSGRPYDRYIMEEIMRPLGMINTRYEVRDAPEANYVHGYRWENDAYAPEPILGHGAYGAMAGIQTSIRDYARWVAFLLDAWPARDGAETAPVRRSSVREMAQGLNFPEYYSVDREGPEGPKKSGIAFTYGMGLCVIDDEDLGFVLSHGGGYPGYGSYVVLLPDRGLGLFAFANRTYATPSRPVIDSAIILQKSGLVPAREIPVSAALAGAYQAALEVYASGDLSPAKDLLAMNFLLDRSAENWARELARLKEEVGERIADTPIKADGMLSGEFKWTCERGTIKGSITLAPTNPPGIQQLGFKAKPTAKE